MFFFYLLFSKLGYLDGYFSLQSIYYVYNLAHMAMNFRFDIAGLFHSVWLRIVRIST